MERDVLWVSGFSETLYHQVVRFMVLENALLRIWNEHVLFQIMLDIIIFF